MNLLFTVRPSEGQPIYRQIVDQVKEGVATGKLKPGDKLPTHRDLGKQLLIAPLTVKKAYDLLEQEGVISMARGRGTFVADTALKSGEKAMEHIRKLAGDLWVEAKVNGIDPKEVKKIIEEEQRKLSGGKGK